MPRTCGGRRTYDRHVERNFSVVDEQDVVDYQNRGFPICNFFESSPKGYDWIITNPPFGKAADFSIHALKYAKIGVAMLCRLAFVESKYRYLALFSKNPPSYIICFSERLGFVEGRLQVKGESSAVAFAWFVWIQDMKGQATQFRWTPVGSKSTTQRKDDSRDLFS